MSVMLLKPSPMTERNPLCQPAKSFTDPRMRFTKRPMKPTHIACRVRDSDTWEIENMVCTPFLRQGIRDKARLTKKAHDSVSWFKGSRSTQIKKLRQIKNNRIIHPSLTTSNRLSPFQRKRLKAVGFALIYAPLFKFDAAHRPLNPEP